MPSAAHWLFITHDLGIVRKFADRVCVMKGGEIVESGATTDIFGAPQHPYTQMLLSAESTGLPDPVPDDAETIAETENLRIWFPIYRGLLKKTVGHIKAVNAATLAVRAGETVGIVGESGSGKTTLALAIMRLISSEGPVIFQGRNIQGLTSRALRPLRADMQIVFQDPFGNNTPLPSRVGSINPMSLMLTPSWLRVFTGCCLSPIQCPWCGRRR